MDRFMNLASSDCVGLWCNDWTDWFMRLNGITFGCLDRERYVIMHLIWIRIWKCVCNIKRLVELG